MPGELTPALEEFVAFARALRGDEKSEAQSFLDHFFRALGHDGVIEAGATFEFRVAKKPGSAQLELIVGGNGAPKPKGGKKFADLLWPDRVLIEMKSRGANLESTTTRPLTTGRTSFRSAHPTSSSATSTSSGFTTSRWRREHARGRQPHAETSDAKKR